VLAGAVALVSLLATAVLPASPSAAGRVRVRRQIVLTGASVANGIVTVDGQGRGLGSGYRVRLEWRGESGHWARAGGLAVKRRGRRVTVAWRAPADLDSVTLRLRALGRRSGRSLAVSQAVIVALRSAVPASRPADALAALPPGQVAPVEAGSVPPPVPDPSPLPEPAPEEAGAAEYEVPAGTHLYRPAEVAAVEPGSDESQAYLVLAPGTAPPEVGGHVAVGPKPGLPDGMFARVLEVTEWEWETSVLVEQAPIDEVLEDVKLEFDDAVEPVMVDEDGTPVASAGGTAGALRFRAAAAGTPAAAQSAFECKNASSDPRDPSELWETGLPFPIELVFQNTHVLHRFDSGSIFPARDPYLLLQFNGEVTAKLGFEPKAAFKCALSTSYRRNHRLRFRVGSIGPVPVSVYLEPAFQFEVSAAGSVSFEQKHFFSITLEKDGFAAPDFRLARSADPPTVAFGSKLEAEAFVGGDLSVMAGGGYASANAQAGVFGAFGPEVSVSIDQDDPACVDLEGRLKADLGVRLELWVKRWDFQLASLSTAPSPLRDPVCAFGAPGDPQPQPVSRSGDPQPFSYRPESEVPYLTIPAADGWWLTGEEVAEHTWHYQWLDPAGNPGPAWTSSGEPLSFARGADGALIAAELTEAGDLHLVRIGETGPEVERLDQTGSYASFVQRLGGEVGGSIYLYGNLTSAAEPYSRGAYRLDPMTLKTTGYAPFYADNPGIVAHRAGVTTVDYEGHVQYAPYSSFGLHPPAEPVVDQPTTHYSGYLQFSVGEGGDVADVDLDSRWCAELTTSMRHPDGTSWTKPLADLVEGGVGGCEMIDLDSLPDGAVAYTLRGEEGVYVLTVGAAGERLSLVRVGPPGPNPTSVVDATGTVVTALTERFDCAEATGTGEQCSQVAVVGEKEGSIVWQEPITGPRQTMTPFTGFVGRPSLTIGKGQIGVQLYDVDPNGCGWDNCIPYSATSSFRTLVEPVEIGLRPSFVWW